jgi:transcriptional regulator with XRE-family HTH domain
VPRIEVPVTPAVLSWAIQQSGYSEQEVAARLDISLSQLRDWESEKVKPTLTQARRLAAFLHRTLAFFLLPRPPETAPPRSSSEPFPAHRRATHSILLSGVTCVEPCVCSDSSRG